MAAPREPTRTHMGAYMTQSISRAKHVGPTNIVGPGDRIGGVLGPASDAKQ